MDKLVEFLTGKIGYTATVIFGFLFPGMLFIFVWNRQAYFELEIIRLVLLAFCISFAVYICNFWAISIVFATQDKAGDRNVELLDIIGVPLVITNIEIYLSLIYKLENSNFTVLEFANLVVPIAFGGCIVGTIPSAVKLLWRKIKNHKR